MSDTPRTDKIFSQFGPIPHPALMAYFSLCRELERECKEWNNRLHREEENRNELSILGFENARMRGAVQKAIDRIAPRDLETAQLLRTALGDSPNVQSEPRPGDSLTQSQPVKGNQ